MGLGEHGVGFVWGRGWVGHDGKGICIGYFPPLEATLACVSRCKARPRVGCVERLSNSRVSAFEKMRGTAAAGNAGVASSRSWRRSRLDLTRSGSSRLPAPIQEWGRRREAWNSFATSRHTSSLHPTLLRHTRRPYSPLDSSQSCLVHSR